MIKADRFKIEQTQVEEGKEAFRNIFDHRKPINS